MGNKTNQFNNKRQVIWLKTPSKSQDNFYAGKWTNVEVDVGLLEVWGNINQTVLELFYALFTEAVFSSCATSLLNLSYPVCLLC